MVNVKADYVTGNAQLKFEGVEIETNVDMLDELVLVLATLSHYAEMLHLHEIEG